MSARLQIEVAAYHEAGHAVMALLMGRQVFEARIFRRSPGSGRVLLSGCLPACGYDLRQGPGAARALWSLTQEQILGDIRILLAGPVAEAKAVGKHMRSLGSRSDFQECTRAIERLIGHWHVIGELAGVAKPKPAHILNHERTVVRRSIARPKVWSLIERLAHYLADNPAAWSEAIACELEAEALPPGQIGLGLGPPPPIRVGRRPTRPPMRLPAKTTHLGSVTSSRPCHAGPAPYCL